MSTLGNNLLAAYWARQNSGYVKDGLVCWLDGINNTRHGHDASTSVWEDLSGNNNDWTIEAGNDILSDRIEKQSSRTRLIASINIPSFLGDNVTSGHTVECVVKALNNQDGVFFIGTLKSCKGFMQYQNNILLTTSEEARGGFARNNAQGAFSVTCVYNNSRISYYNGISQTASSTTIISNSNTKAYLGGRALGSNMYCAIYAFRVYNRELTASEVMQNYKMDKKRFNLP